MAGEWTWRLDKEAIGFVAEWLYDIYSSADRNNLRNKPDPDDPIEVTAVEIARSLADRPGASPDPAAMRRLGDAITQSDLFGSHAASSLGTRRWRCEATFPVKTTVESDIA